MKIVVLWKPQCKLTEPIIPQAVRFLRKGPACFLRIRSLLVNGIITLEKVHPNKVLHQYIRNFDMYSTTKSNRRV